MEGTSIMTERIDLTWPDGDGHPMRIVDSQRVRYGKDEDVIRNGKKAVERTITEFTVLSARPATEDEVRQWRDQ